jgi:hypothetical protein
VLIILDAECNILEKYIIVVVVALDDVRKRQGMTLTKLGRQN